MNSKTLSRLCHTLLILLVVTLFSSSAALAQEDEPKLTLRLNKDFGYSAGDRMQGAFSLRATGPDDLEKVTFYLDGQVLGTSEGPDFRLRFSTDNYAPGPHTFSAEGLTADGRTVESGDVKMRFLSADEAKKDTAKIIVPILAVVFGAMLLSFVVPMLTLRGKKQHITPGAPRSYAPFGGAICPKCGRPFGIHFYKMNLMVGALDRCPYCGKWSLVRRASLEALKAAEQAEIDGAEDQVPEISEEEKLRKELEDSRFQDL